MSLQQWLDNAWIRSVEPSAQVVSNLLAVARREIADASLDGISTDGRFDHAYEAVRSLCELALHACGYIVPKGGPKHQRLIESLKFTVDQHWTEEVDFLDRCRRLRHKAHYERIGVVRQRDADDLLAMARRLLDETQAWLKQSRPGLI